MLLNTYDYVFLENTQQILQNIKLYVDLQISHLIIKNVMNYMQ